MITRKHILKLRRGQVRYLLFRIRTFYDGGPEYPEEAEPFKRYYEKQKGFTSWREFARKWDIDVEGKHHKIILREATEEEEWNTQLTSLARELVWSRK